MSTTTNFGWTIPTVGGSDDTWGTTLNQAITDIDAALHEINPIATPGSIDNMVIGGATPKPGTFTVVATDTIAEKTSATGVTIDGALLKDGGATFSNVIRIGLNQNTGSLMQITNSDTGTAAQAIVKANNGTNEIAIRQWGTLFTTSGVQIANYGGVQASLGLSLIASNGPILFAANGTTEVGQVTSSRWYFEKPIHFKPGASVTPANNGDVAIEFTDNTTLTFRAKGSDGTVRSATMTIA